MIITVDGTGGSGKSSVAKLLSLKLCFKLLNTGMLYRWITSECLLNSVGLTDRKSIISTARNCAFGKIRTDILHSEDISKSVALVSLIPEVREIVRLF